MARGALTAAIVPDAIAVNANPAPARMKCQFQHIEVCRSGTLIGVKYS